MAMAGFDNCDVGLGFVVVVGWIGGGRSLIGLWWLGW